MRAYAPPRQAYCPTCDCTRAVMARRYVQKRKNGRHTPVVEITCKHCNGRIQYGVPVYRATDLPT